MSARIALSLLIILAACNGEKEETGDTGSSTDSGDTDTTDSGDTDTNADPCDMDDDGFVALSDACGGTDCDDSDPAVHPGSSEFIGDDVDQDCDGRLDLGRIEVFDVQHPNLEGWSWNPTLDGMGGAVMTDSSFLGSHNIYFPKVTEAIAPVVYETYLLVQSPEVMAPPVRRWTTAGPMDIVSISEDGAQALLAWTGDDLQYLDLRAGEGAESVDAWAGEDGVLHMIACGNGQLTYLQGELSTGAVLADFTIESDRNRCRMLAPDGDIIVVAASTEGGKVERYRMNATDGFTDYLQLHADLTVEVMDSATRGGDAITAIAQANDIYVFVAGGGGTIIESHTDIWRLSVDVDGAGNAIAAWTDEGEVHAAWGGLPSAFGDEQITYPILEPQTTLLAGISEEGVAIAVSDYVHWDVARGWYPTE